MSKVKFNVNAEYAYLNNFKILQSMSENYRFLATHLFYFVPAHSNQPLKEQQTVSANTRLTASSPSKLSSNAKCRTTSNFSNGQNDTGTSSSPASTTTPSPAAKPPAALPPHPLHLLPIPLTPHPAQCIPRPNAPCNLQITQPRVHRDRYQLPAADQRCRRRTNN